MQCPVCHHTDSRVLESRSTDSGRSIRRRRECLQCKHRFTTYERVELLPVTVVKRNGQKEAFDRAKVMRGVMRACEKTGLTASEMEQVVTAVETQIQQRASREIKSSAIGELVLKQLRQHNEVAYVRFASVYRQFQGIKDFTETLNALVPQDGSSHGQVGEAASEAAGTANNSLVSPILPM